MAKKMTAREQFYYGKGYNKAIEEAADLARKPNKMEVVAALFGKKLGEEFHFKIGKTVIKAKWTEMGLMSTDFAGKWWPCCYMPSLLTGQAVIVNE